ASTSELEEIVVTARRREENIQSTPISVTAFTADSMERLGIDNITDLDRHTANFSIISGQGGSTSQAQISIRGVGQSDFILTSDQSVGLYLDGVYIPRSLGAALELIDIDRIEVLRGPQGTLFGRNTTAGAVQVVSAPPRDELSGRVEAAVGSFDRFDFKGHLNLPLASDRLLTRFSVASLNQDGFGTRFAQDTDGADHEILAARAQFRVQMTDAWHADLVIDSTSKRGNAGLETLVQVDPTDPLLAFYNFTLTSQGLAPLDERWIPADVHDTWANGRNDDDNDNAGVALTFERAGSAMDFKSISAYRQLSAKSGYSFAPTPYPVAEQELDLDQEQWSQEFQISGTTAGRFDWIAGLYYFHEDASDRQVVPFFQPVVATGNGDFVRVPGGFSFSTFISQITDSYAVFGEGTWHFTEQLSATVGARYTHEEKSLVSRVEGAFVRAPGTVDQDWNNVSPRAGLEYRFTPNMFGYLSVSQGFRSGGFNGRATSPVPPESYEPEEITAYEAGLKIDSSSGKWRLNMAGYFYDYTDFQGFTLESFDGVVIKVGNIAEVDIWGAEFELTGKPHERFAFALSAGHNSHDIVDVDPNASITIRPDTDLVNAPEWTASVSADVTLWSGNSFDLQFHGDYSYKSRIEFFLPNFPEEGQSSYGISNARLAFQPRDSRWRLELSGTNLSDENYRVFAENGIALGVAATSALYGRPREWELRFRYDLL
ncbi:MAG: TonB-dependent receptor, partial [Pseudomonadota bacterium]